MVLEKLNLRSGEALPLRPSSLQEDLKKKKSFNGLQSEAHVTMASLELGYVWSYIPETQLQHDCTPFPAIAYW